MIRARHAIALTAAAAATAGGCGSGTHRVVSSGPQLPSTLAQQLAARSDEVAGKLDMGDACGALAAAQQLQQQTIAAINAQRVPGPLQEPLLAAANDLAGGRIHCTSPAKPSKGQDKGKHKGHGKHGGEGD